MRKIESFDDFYIRVRNRIVKHIMTPVYKKKEEHKSGDGYSAVHITYYKVGDLGDTVLSQCVRKTLEKTCNITSFDIVAVNEPISDELIKRINCADILVIGGGGLFLPDSNENSVSGWQWAVSPQNLEEINVPIALYTVGYNYFRGQKPNELFEKSLKLIVRKSDFIGLRNKGSCRSVTDLLGSDEAASNIRFQPCTTTIIRKIYSDLPEKKKTGKIAFNIAFDRSELRYGEDQETILTQVALAAKEIESRGYQIYYVAHCDTDLNFIPYLDREKVNYDKVNISEWFPHRALSFLNEMDCMLGMRGHAQMIPFGLNCEIITLGSHEKMRWFLEDIDALDWYIELREDPEHLKDRIVETFVKIHETEQEKTRQRLLDAQEKLWNVTVENSRALKEILNKSNS